MTEVNTQVMTEVAKEVAENDQLRADIYQLIAALLRRQPSADFLQFLAQIETDAGQDNPMSQAWLGLKAAAAKADADKLEDEYLQLFIGVGRGELLPYGSWYITGSLMDTPLALLRQDLKQLGFARQDDVKEPEDHIAALCEVMSVLLIEVPSFRQLAFYKRHLQPWVMRFIDDLAKAKHADFYQAVAALMHAFFELEAIEFEQLDLNIPTACPGQAAMEEAAADVAPQEPVTLH